MKINHLFHMASFFLLISCASVHRGKVGTIVGSESGAPSTSSPIVISASREATFSDKHYSFFTFTIENKSDRILRVKTSDLHFDKDVESESNVLVGNDLVAWAQGWEERDKKEQHNAKVARTALLIGGIFANSIGRSTDNSALQVIGGAAAVGGAGWSLSSSINQSMANLHNPKKVPEEHIYSSFSVPAEMFVRKWAVIEKGVGTNIKKIYLTVTFENNEERQYVFQPR